MDKFTVANIINNNIDQVLATLQLDNYSNTEVFEIIRGLRVKNIYEGKFEDGITFENGYAVKEHIIPLTKRGVEK